MQAFFLRFRNAEVERDLEVPLRFDVLIRQLTRTQLRDILVCIGVDGLPASSTTVYSLYSTMPS